MPRKIQREALAGARTEADANGMGTVGLSVLPQTSSIGAPWELDRAADSQAHSSLQDSEILGLGPSKSISTNLQVILIHPEVENHYLLN